MAGSAKMRATVTYLRTSQSMGILLVGWRRLSRTKRFVASSIIHGRKGIPQAASAGKAIPARPPAKAKRFLVSEPKRRKLSALRSRLCSLRLPYWRGESDPSALRACRQPDRRGRGGGATRLRGQRVGGKLARRRRDAHRDRGASRRTQPDPRQRQRLWDEQRRCV